jgi:hypothetical protein
VAACSVTTTGHIAADLEGEFVRTDRHEVRTTAHRRDRHTRLRWLESQLNR